MFTLLWILILSCALLSGLFRILFFTHGHVAISEPYHIKSCIDFLVCKFIWGFFFLVSLLWVWDLYAAKFWLYNLDSSACKLPITPPSCVSFGLPKLILLFIDWVSCFLSQFIYKLIVVFLRTCCYRILFCCTLIIRNGTFSRSLMFKSCISALSGFFIHNFRFSIYFIIFVH